MKTARHWALWFGLCLAGFGSTALSEAKPPVWAYLAECSAVFEAASRADVSYAGASPTDMANADQTAKAFLEAAVAEAAAAGQADPDGDVSSVMIYLRPRWDGRTERLFSVRSNLKWISYCGGLGRDYGVLPLAE